ncbi:hypothetical protein HGRIS_011555 [Hohenbuehelia grisea]|uniref:Uncharacterized protein n=1 Tax=Hohenbuehelia grisea TaxID=104357 RepID=A0ABR3JWG0_9AGAR
MAFNNAHSLDLNDCAFNDIGRDQNVVNNVTLVFNVAGSLTLDPDTLLSSSGAGNGLGLQRSPSAHGQPSQLDPLNHPSESIDVLIIQIQQMLFATSRESSQYDIIKSLLDSLLRTIYFARFGVSMLQETPVGSRMERMLDPRLAQCAKILHAIHREVTVYRDALERNIGGLWRRVYWMGHDVAQLDFILTDLRKKLLDVRWPIDALLAQMTSEVWKQLAKGSRLPLNNVEEFYADIRIQLPSLVHIKYRSLIVVDHLGSSIPIPADLCLCHEDLDFILRGYSKNRVGNTFIERGDYQLVRATNDKLVLAHEFSTLADHESVLEVSIILKLDHDDNKTACPRCRKLNPQCADSGGWIECVRCSGKFHVGSELGVPAKPVNLELPSDSSDHPVKIEQLEQLDTVPDFNTCTETSVLEKDFGIMKLNDNFRVPPIPYEAVFFRRISVRQIMYNLSLNEFLRYSQHDLPGGHRCRVLWDLRRRPSSSARSILASAHLLSASELSQYATTPPVTTLHIICDLPPEDWPIVARNENGVTVGDVLDAIHGVFMVQLRRPEWDRLPVAKQRTIANMFDERWRTASDPPTTQARGVRRVDCILRHTVFAGLTMAVGSTDSCILSLRRPPPS